MDNELVASDEFIDRDACAEIQAIDNTEFPDANAVLIDKTIYSIHPLRRGEEKICFSQRQFKFLQVLLETNNPYVASTVSGVPLEKAMRWFKNKKFAEYFEEVKKQKAQANGITLDWIYSTAYEVMNGKRDLSRNQTKVWETIFKSFHETEIEKVLSKADEWSITAKKLPVKDKAIPAEIVKND